MHKDGIYKSNYLQLYVWKSGNKYYYFTNDSFGDVLRANYNIDNCPVFGSANPTLDHYNYIDTVEEFVRDYQIKNI